MTHEEFEPGQEQPKPPQHLSARVPESIAKGAFATGVVVMAMPGEIVLDFLQTLVQPNQLVARVVLPWQTVPSLIQAMRQNLENHAKRFGNRDTFEKVVDESAPDQPESPPSAEPGTPVAAGNATREIKQLNRQVEAEKFYDELRIDEDVLVGAYANGAMINHTEFEFKIDFISSLKPYPVVTTRVFLSEPQLQRLLKSLEEHDAKRRGM